MPSYSLKIAPANHFINWQQDPHGNWLARLVFPEKAEEFRVEVDLDAPRWPSTIRSTFSSSPMRETVPFAYPEELRAELAPASKSSRSGR